MASQLDIKPGTFETISNQEIGTFILNEWTHIKLDGFNRFLMSNIVLKDGAAVIPGSAYELATDSAATSQESGLTGQTLYGQIRITNVAYVGVTLNISGNNFGTYVSNESERDLVADAISGKVAPGSDTFIEAGEGAVFDSSSGLSIVSENSGEIAAWDAGTVYNVAGTLVRIEGITATATGIGLNQNKHPLIQNNSDYWYIPPEERALIAMANRGEQLKGSMHNIHNIQHADYAQNLKIGKKEVNGTQYEFHLIHLDGTIVTGNTTLENLLDAGGPNENPFIDLWAPLVTTTRTLIDAQGRSDRAMTASGGVAATLGEVQMDAAQRVTGAGTPNWSVSTGYTGDGVFSAGGAATTMRISPTGNPGVLITFDNANSTSPNASKTNDKETRVKAIVHGVDYIIVMVAA